MVRLLGSFGTAIILGLLATFAWQSYAELRIPNELRIGVTEHPTGQLIRSVDLRNNFIDRNLRVSVVDAADDNTLGDMLAAGTIDGAVVSLSVPIALLLRGVSTTVVASMDYSAGSEAIVARGELSRVSDLAGARIGYRDSGDDAVLLQEALRRGKQASDAVMGVTKPMNESANAFVAGDLDAAVLAEPYLGQALRRPGSHILFSTREAPGLLPTVIVFRSNVLQTNRPQVGAFLAGWFATMDDYATSPVIRRQLLAVVAVATGQTIDTVSEALNHRRLSTFADNGLAFTHFGDPISLYTSAERFFAVGNPNEFDAAVVDSLFDPSFVRAGLRDFQKGACDTTDTGDCT